MLLNHFSKVVMYFRNAILWFWSGLSWFPIIPVTNFQFVTNISGDMIEMRKNTYMLLNHFSKVVMYFRYAILWFLSGLVDSIIPVTNFQFVTNISGDMIEMRKTKKHLYASNHFSKVVMYFRNAILWFLSGLVDSPIIPVTNFQFFLWLTFQEIWSKWGKSNKNTYMLSESLF